MRRKDGIVALLFIVGLCVGWLLYPAEVVAQTFKGAIATVVVQGSGCYEFALGSGDSRLFMSQYDCGGDADGDVGTGSIINTDRNASSPFSSATFATDSGNGFVNSAVFAAGCPTGESCSGRWLLFDADGQFDSGPTCFQMRAITGTPAGNQDEDIVCSANGLGKDTWRTRYDLIGGNACTANGTGTAGFCGGNAGDPFLGTTTTRLNAESGGDTAASGIGRASPTLLDTNKGTRSRVGRFIRDP